MTSFFPNVVYADNNAVAEENDTVKSLDTDSIEISLLTCSPGKEVYSHYGHTAIRYANYTKNIDIAVNYGMFDFNKPFFILRFIFGLTDYEMGICSFDFFCEQYKDWNRDILQQKLNLTQEEKYAIIAALEKNYLPQNRVYRYNYFYDNCTTRARDILLNNINGTVEYQNKQDEYPSYRKLVHQLNEDYPWARFGNDLLLGVRADMTTDLQQQQFLPDNLMNDFHEAVIRDNDGTIRPLIIEETKIVESGPQIIEREFPLRPRTCAWILFVLIVCVTLVEVLIKKNFWPFDTLLLIADGLVGIIIFLMLFSEHPTTSTNLQLLLFNPLPLIFVYRVTRNVIRKKHDKFWFFAACVLILFLIGGIFQDYAEGTCILALSLLLRCISKFIRLNKR
ncbi:MAG: DUF4105 domain-containing protein [Prevotella sp.]|nr:DUF4105 domain-containing protein [Prevotella sp.]